MASRSVHITLFHPWVSDDSGLSVEPFINCVKQSQPQWVIPIDEISTQVLQQIGIGRLQGGQVSLPAEVVKLVWRSLGAPSGYPLHAVRLRAFETARAAAIPMPAQANAGSLEDCLEFARQHGYPIVLKQEASMGGIATFILENRTALTEFSPSVALGKTGAPWIMQAFIRGRLGMHAVFAEQGRVLAQLSAVQISRRSDRLTAPSSVVKLLRHDAMAASCAAFVAATGLSGCHG